MSRAWVPDWQEIIWIDFNPQAGHEMRHRHPMLVLSPQAFNDKTSIVIGLPMSTAGHHTTNPFAIDNSRWSKEPSFILCNQPKSLDWRQRQASKHPWRRVSDAVFLDARLGLNDILQLLPP